MRRAASEAAVCASAPALTMDGIVHVVRTAGHRDSYLETLSRLFGLAPVVGVLDARMIVRLLGARRLLIATADDALIPYLLIAILRGLMGKKTAGLFLQPHSCFVAGSLRSLVKGAVMRIARWAPGVRMIAITPHGFAPRFREVTAAGVNDPQYWDLLTAPQGVARPQTPLFKAVRARAAGKPILACVGSLSEARGLPYLAELSAIPGMSERFLLLVAGPLQDNMRGHAARIAAQGGMVLEGRLSDEDFESLCAHVDLIWACYAPFYDQASGVFGRAMQLGRPAIVRRGSTIEEIARAYGAAVVAAEYGEALDPAALAGQLAHLRAPPVEDRAALAAGLRRDFIDTLRHSMG